MIFSMRQNSLNFVYCVHSMQYNSFADFIHTYMLLATQYAKIQMQKKSTAHLVTVVVVSNESAKFLRSLQSIFE